MPVPAGEAYIPVMPDVANFGTKLIAEMQPQLAEAEAATAASGKRAGGVFAEGLGKEGAAGTKGMTQMLGLPAVEGEVGQSGGRAGKAFAASIAREGKQASAGVFEAEVSQAAAEVSSKAEAEMARLATGVKAGEKEASGALSRLSGSFAGAGRSIAGTLGAEEGAIGGVMEKAKFQVEGLAGAAESGTVGLGMMGAAAAAAGAVALFALKGAANSASDYATGIRTVQSLTGGTAQESSLLVAQFDHVGISVEAGARAFQFLGKNLENNAPHMTRWLDDSQMAALRSGDLASALPMLSAKYQSLASAQERTTFMMDLFGRGGLALKPLLSETGAQIDEVAKRATDLGLVFTDKQLSDLRSYKYAMNDLGEAFSALKLNIGKDAAPMLTSIANSVSSGLANTWSWMTKTQTSIDEFAQSHGKLGGLLVALKIADDGATVASKNNKAALDDQTLAAQLFAQSVKEGTPALNEWAKAGDAWQTAYTALIPNLSAVSIAQAASDKAQAAHSTQVDTATKSLTNAQDSLKQLQDSNTGQAQKLVDSTTKALQNAQAAEKLARDSMTPVTANSQAGQDRLAQLAQKTADAQQAQADAQSALASGTPQTAAGQDKLAKATQAVADAQAKLNKTQADKPPVTSLLSELTSQMTTNADQLTAFDTLLPQLQAKLGGLGKDPAFVNSFLAQLQTMGPQAVPLLQELVNSSGQTLGGLVDVTGRQIQAAKTAADFQFDKWPPNFKEKMDATVRAAGSKLDDLITQYASLTVKTGSEADTYVSQIQAAAQSLVTLAANGHVNLTTVQQDLLNTAATAADPTQAVQGLVAHLKDLSGPWDTSVSVNTDAATAALNALEVKGNAVLTFLQTGTVGGGGLPMDTSTTTNQAAIIQNALKAFASGQPLPTDLLPKKKAAEGGIVKAVPGGQVVRAGEAGQDEALVPLEGSDQVKAMFGGRGGPLLHIENLHLTAPTTDPTGAELVDTLSSNLGWRVAQAARGR